MADWSLPSLTSSYSDFLNYLKGRDDDLAKMFDGSGSNLPSGAIRWSSTNNRFEKYNGTTWGVLTSKLLMDVDTVDGCTVDDASTTNTALWTANKISTTFGNYYTKTEIDTQASNYVKKNGENGAVTIGTNDNNSLTLETNNTPRFVIGGSGNITISAPASGVALNVGNFTGANSINASGIIQALGFNSTVATGTAPFTVASSTKVANLNADYLDGFSTSQTSTVNTVAVRDGVGALDAEIIRFNNGLNELRYNSADGTIEFEMNSGGVVQSIGLENYVRIKATSAITDGQVVMATGAVGASGVLTGAPATGVTQAHMILGVATEAIANNGFGYVTDRGVVRGINTSAWAEGTKLYYNSAVAGGLTSTAPTTGLNVPIAMVVSSGTNGSIFVRTTALDENAYEPKNANIQQHIASTSNPHNVTKAQVGLGNVDNTSDIDKPISTAVQTALDNLNLVGGISIPASYHIYNGEVSLANSVVTSGFGTTLYTGNGTSQSITTGIDMDTQWGNDASEKFGGLIWAKARGNTNNHVLTDTARGATYRVGSNLALAQDQNDAVSAFNANGFSLSGAFDPNAATTYAAWVFQTTHRVSGTTNHGKAFTCHYNPFTGFTIVKYEGSGLAGHEIPHYLGRKLGFTAIKSTSNVIDWDCDGLGSRLSLNATTQGSAGVITQTDSTAIINVAYTTNNASSYTYIMYGWANSYFDEKNTLIGNYEIGVYQGTGVVGNKVTTRGKPAWVMIKRFDTTANWLLQDNMRGDKDLYTNLSNAETSVDLTDFVQDGFVLKSTIGDCNASGGQYLYMVVYDNDSGSGKSKYPKATDTSTLNLNAHVPFVNGIDTSGNKVTMSYKNETITLSNSLYQGKNYVALLSDNTYVASKYAPNYGYYKGFGDYFDLNNQKWLSNINIFSDEFTTNTWTADTTSGSANSFSVINGKMTVTRYASYNWGYGEPYKAITTVVGKKYRVICDNPSMLVSASSSLGTPPLWGGGKYDFVASTTTTYIKLLPNLASSTFSIDYISVYPLNADGSVDTSSASAITPRNYLDCIVYADQNGQPEYVEQIEKVQYFDAVKANDYRGKNAPTMIAKIDGTTTPPTILSSYGNIATVIRTATGIFDIYFKEQYAEQYTAFCGASGGAGAGALYYYPNKVTISTVNLNPYALQNIIFSVEIFGGVE